MSRRPTPRAESARPVRAARVLQDCPSSEPCHPYALVRRMAHPPIRGWMARGRPEGTRARAQTTDCCAQPISDMPSRSRGAMRPRFCVYLSPLEGVGNAGCPLHPRPRVHFVLVERTRVTTSTPESPDVPARNGFNGFLRALVSAKSARMWERAVLTNRPLLDLSPFVLEGL